MWMIKNSDGKKDLMATLMVASFLVVMVKVIFGGSTLSMLDWSLTVDPIGADVAAVLLGTNTAGYVARRHTDKKHFVEEVVGEDTGAEDVS